MGVRLAVVLLTLPLPVFASGGGATMQPGARVRVTVSEAHERTLVGTLESLKDEGLVLQVDGRPLTIPVESIRRVEVSRGRRASARWTALGAVAGGTVGALGAGCLANKDDYGVLCAGQDDTKYLIGGLVGGLAGGALGAWLGRDAKWDRVDLQRPGSSRRGGLARCAAAAGAAPVGPVPVLDCR
jgi:hypothetical protein